MRTHGLGALKIYTVSNGRFNWAVYGADDVLLARGPKPFRTYEAAERSARRLMILLTNIFRVKDAK